MTLRREAVLAAVVEAEQIEPSDGDVLDVLQASAASEKTTPEKLRAKLEKAGRLDDLLDDLRQRAAVDLLVEHANAVPAPAPGRADREVRADADVARVAGGVGASSRRAGRSRGPGACRRPSR